MLRTASPIGHIAVRDFAQARDFYERVLGLEFVCHDGLAVVIRTGQIMLRLSVPSEFAPVSYSVFGWEVMDIEAQATGLMARGVTFERYGFLGDDQDDSGVWTSPTGDKVAWFKDPFGNLLSLSEHVAP